MGQNLGALVKPQIAGTVDFDTSPYDPDPHVFIVIYIYIYIYIYIQLYTFKQTWQWKTGFKWNVNRKFIYKCWISQQTMYAELQKGII